MHDVGSSEFVEWHLVAQNMVYRGSHSGEREENVCAALAGENILQTSAGPCRPMVLLG